MSSNLSHLIASAIGIIVAGTLFYAMLYWKEICDVFKRSRDNDMANYDPTEDEW